MTLAVPRSYVSEIPPTLINPAYADALTGDESRLVQQLSNKLQMLTDAVLLRYAYYEGEQRALSLGISVPPQLEGLRQVFDGPRIAVDPLVDRMGIDGFRMPGATDVDDELQQHWQANNMDSESGLVHLDKLVAGRGYVVVGSPDTAGASPVMTVESPKNLAMNWDAKTRRVTAALQVFFAEGTSYANLYLPDQTVELTRDGTSGAWVLQNRDQHRFGVVPVVRFPNRQRSDDREGRSEITEAIMSLTDSTCRTMLGVEVAREFYSVPQKYILGASEKDFQDGNGNPMSMWSALLNKFLAIETDDSGNAPTVGQFTAYDPSVYTKIVEMYQRLMASYTQFPPEMFGLFSQANPASADAIRMAQDGLNRRARAKQHAASDPWETVMRLVMMFANKGALPPGMDRLVTDWQDVATPTPGATTDALTKQIQVGMIPATSDVTLKAAGYSAVDRARLAQDRIADQANQQLNDIVGALRDQTGRAAAGVGGDVPASPVAAE